MADLREMKLLENCIKEALRLFPSVPFFGRELREEAVIGKDEGKERSNMKIFSIII